MTFAIKLARADDDDGIRGAAPATAPRRQVGVHLTEHGHHVLWCALPAEAIVALVNGLAVAARDGELARILVDAPAEQIPDETA